MASPNHSGVGSLLRRAGLFVVLAATATIGGIALFLAAGEPGDRRQVTMQPGDASAPSVLPSGAPPVAPAPGAAPRLPPQRPRASAPSGSASLFSSRLVDPSWRHVQLAHHEHELGAIAGEVAEGIDAARQQMSYCLDAEPFVPWSDPDEAHPDHNLPDREPAVLVLYLEARRGAVDVVDVTLDSTGAAMPETLECWGEVLRGHEIPSDDAIPGERYRLRYLVY